MNIREALNLVDHLPPDKQAEIADFIDFLYRRTHPDTADAAHPPLEQEPLCGLWQDREDMADSVGYVRGLRRREWP